MGLKCLFFGHTFRLISQEQSVITKGELAKHECDEFRHFDFEVTYHIHLSG